LVSISVTRLPSKKAEATQIQNVVLDNGIRDRKKRMNVLVNVIGNRSKYITLFL